MNGNNAVKTCFRRERPGTGPKSSFLFLSIFPLILVILLILFYLLVLAGAFILRMVAKSSGKFRESGIL